MDSKVKVMEFKLEANGSAMNDIDLEQRVEALEFQMANVQEDVSSIGVEVTDLEKDIEAQITIIEAEITVMSEGQVISDERILILEGITDNLAVSDFEMNASITELDSRVTVLESLNGTDEDVIDAVNKLESEVELLNQTAEGLQVSVVNLEEGSTNLEESVLALEQRDEELGTAVDELESNVGLLEGTVEGMSVSVTNLEESVTGLEQADEELGTAVDKLDSRVTELESSGDVRLNDSVAFHAAISEFYQTIPDTTVVVFDEINVNLGNGYNEETGQFIVPAESAGVYFIYAHFENAFGENVLIKIRQNEVTVCRAYGDGDSGADTAAFSCGFVGVLHTGNIK